MREFLTAVQVKTKVTTAASYHRSGTVKSLQSDSRKSMSFRAAGIFWNDLREEVFKRPLFCCRIPERDFRGASEQRGRAQLSRGHGLCGSGPPPCRDEKLGRRLVR